MTSLGAKSTETSSDIDLRTHVYSNFLGRSVIYRVYEVDSACGGVVQEWQAGDYAEYLVPLRGAFSVEVDASVSIVSTTLVCGRRYQVPCDTAHRVLAHGDGVLESFLVPRAGSANRAVAATVLDGIRRPGASGSDGRVEVDPHVPGTGLGRKVYHAPRVGERRMARPHLHRTPHLFVCVSGTTQLARRDGAAPRIDDLEPGKVHSVDPSCPHQIRILPGGILASFFPAATWLSRHEGLTELDEDWFR